MERKHRRVYSLIYTLLANALSSKTTHCLKRVSSTLLSLRCRVLFDTIVLLDNSVLYPRTAAYGKVPLRHIFRVYYLVSIIAASFRSITLTVRRTKFPRCLAGTRRRAQTLPTRLPINCLIYRSTNQTTNIDPMTDNVKGHTISHITSRMGRAGRTIS